MLNTILEVSTGYTVLICIALALVAAAIVTVQFMPRDTNNLNKHMKLIPEDFPTLHIKEHMLTSKLWHIRTVMDELGFMYQKHEAQMGSIFFQKGDTHLKVYLKSLKVHISCQGMSMIFQVQNLADLNAAIKQAVNEIYDRVGD